MAGSEARRHGHSPGRGRCHPFTPVPERTAALLLAYQQHTFQAGY